jgi:hypothetical protein
MRFDGPQGAVRLHASRRRLRRRMITAPVLHTHVLIVLVGHILGDLSRRNFTPSKCASNAQTLRTKYSSMPRVRTSKASSVAPAVVVSMPPGIVRCAVKPSEETWTGRSRLQWTAAQDGPRTGRQQSPAAMRGNRSTEGEPGYHQLLHAHPARANSTPVCGSCASAPALPSAPAPDALQATRPSSGPYSHNPTTSHLARPSRSHASQEVKDDDRCHLRPQVHRAEWRL